MESQVSSGFLVQPTLEPNDIMADLFSPMVKLQHELLKLIIVCHNTLIPLPNVTENTLRAIKKIDKIRVDREERHIAKRMKGKKAKEQREAMKELEQSIHIVKAPAALNQDPFT
ncbi:putative ribosome biogenesis protein RLP24 [Capsicum baccatum]|uniref:Ribosome biogenesis protein RLP24 n=1 Tax=Capsicum baccatum TaxID=33114 RepID=A0A2G2VWN3_CAPBA|nr:putative ribosome biogenesis protein RLP24 [Capsicum baccatum]